MKKFVCLLMVAMLMLALSFTAFARWEVCPKCNGSDILRVEGKAGAYGSGNNIITGMTIFSAVLVHRYVCCNCGYSEEWIDKEDIKKLKERFE